MKKYLLDVGVVIVFFALLAFCRWFTSDTASPGFYTVVGLACLFPGLATLWWGRRVNFF